MRQANCDHTIDSEVAEADRLAVSAEAAPFMVAASRQSLPHPDAELLTACAEFEAAERAIRSVYEAPDRTVSDDEARDLTAPYEDQQDAILDTMGRLTAKTADGVHARARLLAIHNGDGDFGWDDGTTAGRLLEYVMRDAAALPLETRS